MIAPCQHCASVPSGDGIIHERTCQRHEAGFARFASWQEVLAFAATGAPLFYWAPMQIAPVRLYSFEVRPRTIRITPPGATGRGRMRTADPFSADAKHLDRFRRRSGVQS